MKKLLIGLILLSSMSSFASSFQAETVAISYEKLEKAISEKVEVEGIKVIKIRKTFDYYLTGDDYYNEFILFLQFPNNDMNTKCELTEWVKLKIIELNNCNNEPTPLSTYIDKKDVEEK